MPMNRVQFQPGLSMPEFFERYGTEAQCREALERARWPDGFVCPRCGGSARSCFERGGLRYWQCARCPRQTSLLSGTLFEATKLPLSRWLLAMQLLTQSKNNVSALELKQQHLGVCYRSAWLMKHKILEAMRLAELDRQLTGRVEIDNAYLGGERSGGKTGRGSENKVPFVAAVQTTDDCRPHLACLSPRPFTNEAMQDFLATHTALPLTVVSDGLSCFKVASALGVHEREVTGGGKASVLNEKFRAVNTLIGNVKTALTGTYHAINFAKYAYRYLAKVQFRFNRRYDLRAILGGLLRAMVNAPRRPECGIRVAEVHR